MKREIGFVATLVLALSKMSWGVTTRYDLGQFGESYFRMAARDWSLRGIAFESDGAPLYSLWIAGWDHFSPAVAHYGNLIAITLLFTLTAYALARHLTSATGAFFTAAAIALLQINLPSETKSYLFSTCILAGVCAFAFCFKRRSFALSLVLTGVAAATFVRSENGLGGLLLLPLLFFSVRREFRTNQTRLTTLVPLTLLPFGTAGLLAAYFGNPFKGTQLLTSFSLSFVRHWAEGNQPEYPWGLNFSAKFQELLPGVASLTQALLLQPKLVFAFFVSNLLQLPQLLVKATFSFQNFPGEILAVVVFISLIAGRTQLRPFLSQLKARSSWPLPAVLLALSFSPLLSSVLISPEPFYLTLPVLAFWIFAGAWLAFVLPPVSFAPMPSLPTWAGAVALLLVTPFSWSPWSKETPPDKPYLRMIRALSRLPLREGTSPIVIADDFRGIATYLSPRFVRVPPWKRETPLFAFLKNRNVGILVTIPSQPFLPEAEYNALQSNASAYGYQKFSVYNHSDIYVREDLLAPSQKFSQRD